MVKLAVLAFLLAITLPAFAHDVKVKLRELAVTTSSIHIIDQEEKSVVAKFPVALGMAGESYDEKLKEAKTIVVASIVEVNLLAITALENWDLDGEGPLLWYRVVCKVHEVKRGAFASETFQFITCYGAHRVTWPYVRGFAYQFGIDEGERDGDWWLIGQVRTSRFPPYDVDSFLDYGGLNAKGRRKLGAVDAFITKKFGDVYSTSSEVSIENEYVVVTSLRKSFTGFGYDYGRRASVEIYLIKTGEMLDPESLFPTDAPHEDQSKGEDQSDSP